VAVTVALAISGAISAHLGQAPKLQSMARMVAGGIIAMAITYGMGFLVGTPL
jgi:VIT1/CCC1 family predicted Fe2+/Mn2+ transporter